MKATRIFETCLYAEDLAAAEQFYRDVLGLEVVYKNPERMLAFRCGPGVLLVFNPRRTRVRDLPVPAHGTDGAGHMAFLTPPEELDAWREHLRSCGVAIETETNWPEGGCSVYFRDPAGNSVELAPPTLWGFGGKVPG
jgi:catechol 2,3-dioxygenase-like lactoylglutathione lyase family enzyme